MWRQNWFEGKEVEVKVKGLASIASVISGSESNICGWVGR